MASPRVRRARKLAIIQERQLAEEKQKAITPTIVIPAKEDDNATEDYVPKGYKKIKQKDVAETTLQKRIKNRLQK